MPSFQVSLIRIHPGNNVPSNSSSHGSSASSASSASNEFFFFDSLLASTSPQAELVQCAALCAASAPCVYLHHCDLSALLVDFSAEGETQIVASQVHSGSLTYIRRGAVVSISNSLLPAEWTRSSAVATVLGQKVKGKA
ncbi:hypothetical protein EON64_00175 [archaeon]|nr:MAG: hypothetical protein EON64_00175 [archaeon]